MLKYRKFLVMSVVLLLTLLPVNNVKAYNTFGGHKNAYGITNEKYWLQNSGSQIPTDWQAKYIDDSMYQWNSSSQTSVVTPMHVTRTLDRSSSIMDFFFTHHGDPNPHEKNGVLGYTEMFLWGNKVSCMGSNWSSANIWYGGSYWYNPNYVNNEIKRCVFSHEIGHGIGLAHASQGTLMYEYMSTMFKPTLDDLLGVNYLY